MAVLVFGKDTIVNGDLLNSVKLEVRMGVNQNQQNEVNIRKYKNYWTSKKNNNKTQKNMQRIYRRHHTEYGSTRFAPNIWTDFSTQTHL